MLTLLAAGMGFSTQLSGASEATPMPRQTPPAGSTIQKSTLAEIVRLVRTETEFADESIELNVGSGFVAGRYFFTVYHNLIASRDGFVKQTVSVDGDTLKPVFIDPYQDVAVFELTDELCRRHCNDLTFDTIPTLEYGRPVFWLRKVEAQWELKESTMLNLAVFDRIQADAGHDNAYKCADNLVVEVEEPFVPGSSGAPVVDAMTGRIVGIIQGSFKSGNERTGFFKPIHCVGFQQAGHIGSQHHKPG